MKYLLLTALILAAVLNANSQDYLISNYNSQTANGWETNIPFFLPCQQIIASYNPALCIPPPSPDGFIDLCPGDTVTFAGNATFPQNDLYYHQSISTSLFVWTFGDGNNDTGLVVHHHYQQGGLYNVQLIVVDSNNCQSTNSILLKIRQSAPPLIFLNTIPPLQAWSTYILTAGLNANNTVHFIPFHPIVLPSVNQDTAMFIPDGGALGGQCFQSNLVVDHFNPEQTVVDSSDIQAIRAKMEHSFIGDLLIKVICPNGQEAVLKEYIQSGGAYLGIPLGGTNHHAYDCSNPPPCLLDPTMNPPGTRWNYSWTMDNPQYNTMQTYANTGNCQSPSGSNQQMDSSSYLPFQSFTNLIGCPLNGIWTLKICDYWGSDNGWVFNWGIDFDSTLMPVIPAFTVNIDSIYWTGPFISQDYGDSIQIIPDQPGVFQYTVTLIDSLGCSYDTVVSLTVNWNVGISEKEKPVLTNLVLYPNPASNELIVNYSLNEKTDIKIFLINAIGQLVKEIPQSGLQPGKNYTQLSLSGYAPGLYHLLINAEHTVLQSNFIIIKN